MSNSKYKWETHMPRMIQLYFEGKPISDIHAAIQDPANGFDPKIYDVLTEAGYPTKPKERKEFLQRHRSGIHPNHATAIEHPSEGFALSSTTPLASDDIVQLCTTSAASTARTVSAVDDTYLSFGEDLNSPSSHTDYNGKQQDDKMSNAPYFSEDGSGPNDDWVAYLDCLFEEDDTLREYEGRLLIQDETNRDGSFGSRNQSQLGTTTPSATFQQETPRDHPAQVNPMPDLKSTLALPTSTPELDKRSSRSSVERRPSATTSVRPPSSHFSNQHRSTQARRVSGTNSIFSSRFSAILPSRFRSDRSSSPAKRTSKPTRDSGYESGRNSPLPHLSQADTNEQFPEEFKALYRVPCCRHEPQRASPSSITPAYEFKPPDQYRDVTTCSTCLYSAVHNLSWSARYLKLQVFQSELRLDLYDIHGLDVVGNSALHYAAAGGADSEYFVSLIQAGVNPYQLNTEGQLFLHCLHPNEIAGTDSLQLLSYNLVNILNYLNIMDPRGTSASLNWRDNDGRTVLDALANHIPDDATKVQTFQLIQNAGYPLKLTRQFSETASSCATPNNRYIDRAGDDFGTTQDKQQKAYEILICALSDQPNYVDPETGDNVLHALARLKLPEKGSVLSRVKDFVAQDVDLNLHNRDRHSPLAAFIQERPFLGIESEETGATMSKYLDALLWKDIRHRIPNKINVNMRNKEGAPALYYAAVRGRPDSVRSLIEGGANVNARVHFNGASQSILQATLNARSGYVKDAVKMNLYNNVISYLEHEGAVPEPTLLQERGLCANSVRVMPM